MTLFLLIAAALILGIYALFWWGLRQPPPLDSDTGTKANLAAHRQRRKELERELAEGRIDRQEHEQLVAELDRDLLDLLPQAGESRPANPLRGMVALFVTLGILPLVALALYFSLGRPDLLNATASDQTPPLSLDQAIAKIERRLEDQPDDLEGWILLARSYQATGRLEKALTAYRRALQLAPENPDIQARYAEALAQSREGNLSGEPQRLLQQVLQDHPDHPYALWLAGMAALQQGDRATARRHWEKLLAQMPEGSKARQQLQAVMRQSGLISPRQDTASQAAANASVQVRVSLSPHLVPRTDPDDPVYIFARAAEGPSMPLAVVRKQVKDLPVTVILDDSLALTPQLKLSRFPRVVLGARVAKSGDAKGAPGDLEGWTKPVELGQDKPFDLVIDEVRS